MAQQQDGTSFFVAFWMQREGCAAAEWLLDAMAEASERDPEISRFNFDRGIALSSVIGSLNSSEHSVFLISTNMDDISKLPRPFKNIAD